MSNESLEKFQESVVTMLEASLKNGQPPSWVQPWSKTDGLFRNYEYGKPYAGISNQIICSLMMSLQGFSDPRFLSWNQIQKMNLRLKAGSKVVWLLAFNASVKTYSKTREDGTSEEITAKRLFAKSVKVFNVQSIENWTPEPITEKPPIVADDVVLELVKTLGIDVSESRSHGAYYLHKSDRIEMPKIDLFKSTAAWAATLLHEIVHWTSSRLGRDLTHYQTDRKVRSDEELVAELGSMRLCQLLGIDGHMDTEHLAYVHGWLGDFKSGALKLQTAISQVEKAVKFICEKGNLFPTESEVSVENQEYCTSGSPSA